MDRSKLRILDAAAIILEVLGEIVAQSFGGSGYLVLAVVGTLSLVSLISAIINVARLKRWSWMVCLVVFSTLSLLLHVIMGLTTSKQLS